MSRTLTADLLAWFAAAARAMPWRGELDPYRIWVSEVMLQQTQVETVKPYYERFVARFPTLADLGGAELDAVLALWQGLGYYRRARGLYEAARRMLAEHGGQVPGDPAVLRRLPGFGDYTAGAVASIAFGVPVPAIDGNVNRVITRLFALAGDPREGETKRAVREQVTALMPTDAPGDFNQALMELGATICLPQPRCGQCPVREHCRAFAAGEPARYPELRAAPPPREALHLAAVIRREGRLLVAQRPADGRWGGLWELPRIERPAGAPPEASLREGLREALGVEARVGELLATLRHGVSGEKITLAAYAVELGAQEPEPRAYAALRWVESTAGLAMATPQRRLLRQLEQGALPGV